jgi:thymidylate synthase (FAD)
MALEKHTGDGKVVLIAGGGKVYADIAARFVRSERPLEEIVASPYSREIVENILDRGHKAALEFDFFLFGIEGYSRVTEVQLVRKRLASYLIKSGRAELLGKRRFSLVYPPTIANVSVSATVPAHLVTQPGGAPVPGIAGDTLELRVDAHLLAELAEQWYDKGLAMGVAEEDLRYMKPQATECKAIIGMNAHALLDWFAIRCCRNAQHEIRDLAIKMLKLCKKAAPDLFRDAGASCVQMGYCPENTARNPRCGHMPTKEEALKILEEHARGRQQTG